MENTTLTFMGETLSEQYRPIEFIVNQCQRFMDWEDAPKNYFGGFMCAVLNNDFMNAVGRADNENIQNIRLIAIFLNMKGYTLREKFSNAN
jgi:hypothetical protein